MSTVQDWRWLASPEDIVELCELFFTGNAAKRALPAPVAETATPGANQTPAAGQAVEGRVEVIE
jgi:hypothetical protein